MGYWFENPGPRVDETEQSIGKPVTDTVHPQDTTPGSIPLGMHADASGVIRTDAGS